MKGIIIIGHGSRNKEAQEQFLTVVEKVRQKSGKNVEGAFMEMAEPGFFEAVEKMAAEGVASIVVYPLFLFSGVHIKEDIPQMIKSAEEKYGSITFSMAEPIGPREALIQIVLDSVAGL